ncbi:type I restriction enzyme, S subunit [Vibrio crassostreae]|nr:type I restriction enzyme, S subunit [Vibrio crassostreae]
MSLEKKVPEIRFKGFSWEWDAALLKDVSTYSNGGSFENDVKDEGKYELVTLKSVDMNGNLVSSGRCIDVEAPTLPKDTLVMILSEQSPGLLGMTARIPVSDKYVLNQRVAEIRPLKNIESYFLSMAVNRNQRYFSERGAGTKVQNISKPNVENYEFLIPQKEEQAAIGNYFQKLDSLIKQHQKKHDKLSNLKKAMLEKMFPKQDEAIPEIRFKEFSREWGSKKLRSVASFHKGKGLPKSSIQGDGIYSCIHYGELFTKYSEVIEMTTSRTNQNDNFFSVSNDVLMPTSDVTPKGLVKPCCIKQNGVVLGGDILVIRPNNQNFIDGAFLSRFIRTREQQVLLNVTGSTVFHLYASSIENLDIAFPSIEEQTAIGNYFQKLDTLINQHQQQITKLTNIKQACLSKMFV